MKVLTIGKTDEGRELNIIVVASEETIRNLDATAAIWDSSPTRAR